MSQLALNAIVTGVLLIAVGLAPFLAPGAARSAAAAFPRSVWPGRVLAAAAVIWFAVLLLQEKMQFIEEHRFIVYLGAPLVYLAAVFLMDEMLSVRALGAVLMLLPQPILDAAFVHDHPSRLLMTSFAYVLAIAGCVLVWSPYYFRKAAEALDRMPFVRRGLGAGLGAFGALLLALGLFRY